MSLLLGLLPIIGQLLPQLIPAMGTPIVDSILNKAGAIAEQVFGTKDPTELKARLEADAAKDGELTKRFVAQLEAKTREDLALLEDLRSAREMTARLADAGSPAVWGAPIMSVLVTMAFFVCLIVFMRSTLDLPEFQKTVLNVLIGYLGASFQQAVSFWLGTSKSSLSNQQMLGSLAASAANTSARVAETAATTAATAATVAAGTGTGTGSGSGATFRRDG